ncbi:MerR family transcriptional regulator [Thermoflavimicrobium daqui]|jgi:DNA-binding transcriptional MerR regulator|uniref:Transcriptional regulator n=1 Tax=Thermoflavimicrobium daqui TaxID=2137476 RepID=A0A364K7Y4_9BACL|nr:MerR family transcriptional regulator [Thermoflavimicrobium daqui]RAL26411.1 transcriptional regulator [Thermoflavimicrobium daqui]
MYSIGELSKKANVSRRTLHYYDEIGLLKPTRIDDKNYRYYDQNALLQLQEILLLKSIGFKLNQIKQIMNQSTDTNHEEKWMQSLNEQINWIQKEKARLERKQYYLRATLHSIKIKGKIHAKEIFDLIQLLEDREMENGVIPAVFKDGYFTNQEKETLEQLPVLGSNNPYVAQFVELLRNIRRNMHEPPNSSVIQTYAKQLHELSLRFFGDNPALADKYWERIKPREGQPPIVYGMDQDLMDYIDKMFAYFHPQQERE